MIFKIIITRRQKSSRRCSRPLCSSQSTGGTHPAARPAGMKDGPRELSHRNNRSCSRSLRTQQRACADSITRTVPTASGVLSPGSPDRHHVKCSTHELPARTSVSIWGLDTRKCQKLLRKEVIQPHLPVRLPCYDLVLITDPTFDGSLHKGWATGFRCYRLS